MFCNDDVLFCNSDGLCFGFVDDHNMWSEGVSVTSYFCQRPLLSLSYLAYKYLPKQRKYSYFKYIQIFNFSVTSTEELNFGYSTEGS
jgi:hypothetical protein